MKKILALTIVSSMLFGCGMTPGAGLSGASFASLGAKKTLKHGLGCELKGLHRMANILDYEVAAETTKSVDLREGCSPISNQGMSNACVGFASVDGLAEYLARKNGHPQDFAPRFIWNLARKNDHTLDQNIGTWPHTALKLMDNIGLVQETDFPFPTAQEQSDETVFMKMVAEVPSNDLIEKAKKNRLITGYKSVASVSAMKKSVADGMPVVFAIAVFNSISETKADGVIPMPRENEEMVGGHAILCVGYNDAKRQFIVRNSWGSDWGDHGYGYLPYDYVKRGYTYEGFTAKL